MEDIKVIPLGSIVKLKSIKEYIMIIGVEQIPDGVKYDYSGCVHPYGFTGLDKIVFFNSTEVEKIIYKGYEDEDSKEFYEDIIWLRASKEDK